MAKSMKLGGGGRFEKLKGQLAGKSGIKDPGAVAAAIGREKYGAKKMTAMAEKGKAKAEAPKVGLMEGLKAAAKTKK